VKGEDPTTPGLLPKGIDPGTVTIPQYRVNKTKQHTHTYSSMSIWVSSWTIVVDTSEKREVDSLHHEK